jgi:hypothetical protein
MSFDEELGIGAGASQIAPLVLSKLKNLFSAPNTSSAVVHASIALTVDSKFFWTHNLGLSLF